MYARIWTPPKLMYLADCVHPEDREQDKVYPERTWLEKLAPDGVICRQCMGVDRRHFGQPCRVTLKKPPKDACWEYCWSQVEGTRLLIFHRKFLDLLQEHLPRYWYAEGPVLLADGSKVDTHATFYTRHTITAWSGPNKRYWACPSCGAVYSEPDQGQAYLLRRQISHALVQQDALGRLYVDESLAVELEASDPLGNLRLDPVPIRDEPPQGAVPPGT